MYLAVLTIHNVLRWFVILFGLMAAIGGFVGWLGKRPWGRGDNRAGMLFTMVLDLQFLVGALLYFVLSPITRGALGNMAGAMGNAVTRYFAVEHVALMVLAVVVAHVTRSRTRRAAGEVARHRTAAIGFSLSMLLILAAIPWPFLQVGRPLLRLLGIDIG